MAKRTSRKQSRPATSNTYRFFVSPDAIQGDIVHIDDPALAHQIGNVLRLRPSDEVTLLDNTGAEYLARLDTVERHSVSAQIAARQLAAGEPRLKLALYVALLKAERFEWILQKGVELGVSVFVPIICERSVIDAAGAIGAGKIERWERIVREAAEQSRRGRLPELHPAQPFAAACEQATRDGQTLLLWEGSGGRPIKQLLRADPPRLDVASPPSLAVFSGPEGGWTEGEVATAIMYNINLVSLGSRTLRAETAPIAAAAVIFYEHGDMEITGATI
jgi:16S rRNA (uracil1498-N3)-methyltransferase